MSNAATAAIGSAPRDRVRQAPVPGGDPRQAPQIRPEWCPVHGHYVPSRNAVTLRRRAVSGEETWERSQRLLDAAARVRRTCRLCRGGYPRMGVWAERLRQAIEADRQGKGQRC